MRNFTVIQRFDGSACVINPNLDKFEFDSVEIALDAVEDVPTIKHIPDGHSFNSGRLSNNPFASNKDGLD